MKIKTKELTLAALLGGLYVTLTVTQHLLLPGSANSILQFRVSEMLCVFALITPMAIPALTVGCFISNLLMGLGAIDLVLGPVATLLALVFMRLLSKVKIKQLPILSFLSPPLFNGLIVGAELAFFIMESNNAFNLFLISAGLVFIGETVVMALSIPFYFLIKNRKLFK